MPGQVGEQEEAAEGSWQLSCSWHPSSCWGQRLARQTRRCRTALGSRTPPKGNSLWKQHLGLTCPTQRTWVSQPCLELTPCPLCPPGLLPALLHLQRSDSASILSDSGQEMGKWCCCYLFVPISPSPPQLSPKSSLSPQDDFPPFIFLHRRSKDKAELEEVVLWFGSLPSSRTLPFCTDKGEEVTLVLTNVQHPREEMDFRLQRDGANTA